MEAEDQLSPRRAFPQGMNPLQGTLLGPCGQEYPRQLRSKPTISFLKRYDKIQTAAV